MHVGSPLERKRRSFKIYLSWKELFWSYYWGFSFSQIKRLTQQRSISVWIHV